ncbi:MAG: carboxypeptidase-like regulatory domain-containing protein [bacterium]
MKYLCLTAAITLLCIVPGKLSAQFVHGHVHDTIDSTGIASAHVEGQCIDAQGYFSTYTDTTGYYVVNDTLSSGLWKVTAAHPQYNAQRQGAQLPSPRYLNFYLVPQDTKQK